MYLTSKDRIFMEGSLKILSNLYDTLRNLPVQEAKEELSEEEKDKYTRKDTKDTTKLDIIAETSISTGDDDFKGHLSLIQKELDEGPIIITEERGKIPEGQRIYHDTPVIISDPIDGSSYLDDIIKRHGDSSNPHQIMGDLFDMERDHAGPKIQRYASSTSLTLLRDNMIKYSMILNLFTGEIYIASPEGVFSGDIMKASEVSDISTPLKFIEDENLTMLCYTTEGKYDDNKEGTHLRFFDLHPSSNAKPGPIGPMRFTNLVQYDSLENGGIGIVAHNGEKIQEILPNIVVARYSQDRLRAYKLYCDPEYTHHRAEKGMTPNLANSIYSNGLIKNTGIDLVFLNNHDYPSEFRDTTVIISTENDAALTTMSGMVEKDYAVRIV